VPPSITEQESTSIDLPQAKATGSTATLDETATEAEGDADQPNVNQTGFLAVGTLAWNVYKACRDAPESFRNISAEVLSLHAVLKEVEEALSDHQLTQSRQASLATITEGCQKILYDLQAVVNKYESLETQSKRTWDRLKWGSNDIAEIRARLTSNTSILTAFTRQVSQVLPTYNMQNIYFAKSCYSSAQPAVEKRLNRLIGEFQDGKYEG
jgi:hypothetical protein